MSFARGAPSLASCNRRSGGTDGHQRAGSGGEASGAVNAPRPSLRVAVSAESSASPEQVLAAGYDFSERRARIWGNVKTKRLEVHERGDAWAEVTEGTMVVGVFWERCRYDWSSRER